MVEKNCFSRRGFKVTVAMVLAYCIAATILQWFSVLQYQLSIPPKGFYDKKFEAVAKAFRQNFEMGLEREGAHLTVIQNGKVIINLWNGYSDSESYREWNDNTRTVLFSTTKAVAALCLAMQVDRGRVSYDDLVVKYWPEYGQGGKHMTTVEDILTHKAGIPYHDNITIKDVLGEKEVLKIMEQTKPVWEPGSATGYHALTFGFLVDGIFRRVDEKGRSIKTFLQEEIADKYGIDTFIGLPKQKFNKLARLTQPGLLEYARDVLLDIRMIIMLALMYGQSSDSLAARTRAHPVWLPLNFDTVALNDPNIVELNMAAVAGVSDAYNLAKLFSLAIDGTLLGNRTLAQITRPTVTDWHLEQVLIYPFAKGRGFLFDKHPVNRNSYIFGHSGYGCQALDVDFDNKIVIAYVTNGLKTGSGKACRTHQLIFRSLYQSL